MSEKYDRNKAVPSHAFVSKPLNLFRTAADAENSAILSIVTKIIVRILPAENLKKFSVKSIAGSIKTQEETAIRNVKSLLERLYFEIVYLSEIVQTVKNRAVKNKYNILSPKIIIPYFQQNATFIFPQIYAAAFFLAEILSLQKYLSISYKIIKEIAAMQRYMTVSKSTDEKLKSFVAAEEI